MTAPRSVPFGDRHWYAKIGYYYSRDAKSWKYGGDLSGASGNRGVAGSMAAPARDAAGRTAVGHT
ncbi:hypothetical protein [Streptomyces sp. NPDC007991]|uniref:hypothetical protein n=1 Tax=Streptomyces sp. NPDC007991 TaxID=3364803 RepID=UPI0036EC6043